MGLRQRFPVYARPLPFLVGAATFLFGFFQALAWSWNWSLQTGNVFLQIVLPSRLLRLDGSHLVFLILAALGLGLLVALGGVSRARAQRQLETGAPWWLQVRFRFYPLTFFLGAFLAYFGTIFLFNATIAGDVIPGGAVLFVYLNYAGILHRAAVSIIGLAVLLAGVVLALVVAVQPGSGLRAPQPRYHPVQAPAPEPPPAAPTPPKPRAVRASPAPQAAPGRPRSRASGARKAPAPKPSASRTS